MTSLYEIKKIFNVCKKGSILVLSLSEFKRYFIMENKLEILSVSSFMCLCEMILDNTGRPCIDFDCDIFHIIDQLTFLIHDYFVQEYKVEVTIRWKWSDHYIKHWHCIISGIYFYNCWINGCKRLIKFLRAKISNLFVDEGIYRENSSLRLVGQFKYHEGSYVKKLMSCTCCDISCLFVSFGDRDKKIEDTTNHLPTESSKSDISSISCKIKVPLGFRYDKVVGNYSNCQVIRLKRIYPSMCVICNRVHTSDNAYIILNGENIEFRCYRNSTNFQGKQKIKYLI